MPNKLARVATRTSLFYAFFAALWIVLSDKVVRIFPQNSAMR